MRQTGADAPLTERVWESLEAALSEGRVPPLRILLATDGSDAAAAAGRFVAQLPLPAGSTLDVLTVLDIPEWRVPDSLLEAEGQWAREVGEAARSTLARPGIHFAHATLRGAPAHEILKAAGTLQSDLIVVGSHGRTGLQRFLLGSVAENVARHADRPVLIAREPAHGLKRVVLAVDGSEHAVRATRVAGRLPLPPETEVVVCHVVRPYYPAMGPEYPPNLDLAIDEIWNEQRAQAERLVAGASERLGSWGKRVAGVVRKGDPATQILELAAEIQADLVIAGARGMSAIRALLVGSVADRLLRAAGCSVLIAH